MSTVQLAVINIATIALVYLLAKTVCRKFLNKNIKVSMLWKKVEQERKSQPAKQELDFTADDIPDDEDSLAELFKDLETEE